MLKNQFKEGLAKGAEMFEQKFQMQEEKVSEVANSLHHKLDGIDKAVDEVINIAEEHDEILYQWNKEKKFRLEDSINIDMLDALEKEFLAGVIATYVQSVSFERPLNENQKEYIRVILQYLGLLDLPMGVPLSLIENIESLKKQKMILKVLMEIIFLKNESFELDNDLPLFLEYFSVNKKSIIEMKESIVLLYDAIGVKGIIQRYIPINPTSENVQVVEEEINVIEDYYIAETLVVDDEQTETIKNKIVHIQNTIFVNGDCTFENCDIIFESEVIGEAIVVRNGTLQFQNCTVTTNGSRLTNAISLIDSKFTATETTFTKCSTFMSINNSEMLIESCSFYDCTGSMFKGDISFKGEFHFINSLVQRHTSNFVHINGKGEFENSHFIENIHKEERDTILDEDVLLKMDEVNLYDCKFQGFNQDCKDIKVLDISNRAKLSKCIFKNILLRNEKFYIGHSALTIGQHSLVEHCQWNHSAGIFVNGMGTMISNCTFTDGYSALITGEPSNVENCTFKNCKNDFELNVVFGHAIISFHCVLNKMMCTIQNCTFVDCDTSEENQNRYYAKKNCIIGVRGSHKKDSVIATIHHCIFKNCKTGGGTILNHSETNEKWYGTKVEVFATEYDCQYIECE